MSGTHMTTDLDELTIRDFGGGWDVSDSDKALSSKFQPVSDNVVRGTDGHVRVRYGNKLFADFKNGTEIVHGVEGFPVQTFIGENRINFNRAAHGLSSGNHITIASFSSAIGGIPTSQFIGRSFGVRVIDADNYTIYTRQAATANATVGISVAYTTDNHVLTGDIIFGRYFKDRLYCFCQNGEIGTIDINGAMARVWSNEHAGLLTLTPWGWCDRISAEIIRSKLMAVNGRTNDKPLVIDGINATNYLVDASTLSNGAIPRADFVIAAATYMILVNTEYGTTKLEIGAKNTTMTCSREVAPSDAVEIDVGMLTQTVDSTILGASVIRSKVFIAFSDLSMLGQLGIYTTVGVNQVHEPDFNDTISQFGSFSHASILSLGNDLFCAGMNGVNSLELSKSSGEFAPQTISDLIHPVMLRHFARLSEDDRRYKTFAVYDQTSRSYMLFLPKYTEVAQTLGTDPVFATSTLQPYNLMIMRVDKHLLDRDDYVTIAGATNFSATLTGAMINGVRKVHHVIDDDTIVVECDAYLPHVNQAYGGSAITITPVNDETTGYIYEYNQRLKIRRWTRFNGWNFRWGCVSQFNKMFFGKGCKVYQKGDNNSRFSADYIADYDVRTFTSGLQVLNQRIRDATDGKVYRCIQAYTTGGGAFAAERLLAPAFWEEYLGEEIEWVLETSWTDFKQRMINKQIELARFDTEGTASFDVSVFTNSVMRNLVSYALEPVRTTGFVGGNTPGFGGGDQPFGGGRNTTQEWLHDLPAFGKLFKFRFSGSSIYPLKISAATFYYRKSKVLT